MKAKKLKKYMEISTVLTPKQMGKIIGGDPQPIDIIKY